MSGDGIRSGEHFGGTEVPVPVEFQGTVPENEDPGDDALDAAETIVEQALAEEPHQTLPTEQSQGAIKGSDHEEEVESPGGVDYRAAAERVLGLPSGVTPLIEAGNLPEIERTRGGEPDILSVATHPTPQELAEAVDEPYGADVATLFEHGITETPYAYYGTSVEALLAAARTGRLPAEGPFGTDVYYAPESLDPGIQESHAQTFANESARAAYLSERIPVSYKTLKFMIPGVEETERPILEEAAQNGYELSARELRALYHEASNTRKGVLLGLSEAVTVDYDEQPGDTETDRKVTAPGGLSLQYVTGIEALGNDDYEMLAALQARVRHGGQGDKQEHVIGNAPLAKP